MVPPRTVLVIDDDPHIRRIIQLKLKKAGYHVLMARNGEEGLELIRSERPDAVVTDINMPKLDGRTLCRMTDQLKAERPFLTVVMTARISSDEREWVAELTDTQFLEKPFSPARLLATINHYFENDNG